MPKRLDCSPPTTPLRMHPSRSTPTSHGTSTVPTESYRLLLISLGSPRTKSAMRSVSSAASTFSMGTVRRRSFRTMPFRMLPRSTSIAIRTKASPMEPSTGPPARRINTFQSTEAPIRSRSCSPPEPPGGTASQASHWKDNQGLGIMDPTASNGELLQISDLDLLGFDVIGYNIIPEPSSLALIALCGGLGLWIRRSFLI